MAIGRFPGTTEKSPHAHELHKSRPKILDTILQHIGDTPLVRVNRITEKEGIKVRGAARWAADLLVLCF
jgi:hypothetical protein